jgi:hypothetical protein
MSYLNKMIVYSKDEIMNRVKAEFEAELPFWLCMDNDKYEILIDGKIWFIELYNDSWSISMGNELDGTIAPIVLVSEDIAKESDKNYPNELYYHKQKLKTVLQMGFSWNLDEKATEENAKAIFEKHLKWCTQTFLKATNRFIEIYRTSDTKDKIPTALGHLDISSNWWYTLYLNDDVIERVRLGLDYYSIIRRPPFKTNKKVQTEIANKLKTDYMPPSWQLILENAVGLHRRGNYRMAVIESNTGFELFLIDYLRKKYKEKNYDENLINHLLCRPNPNFMLKEGLERAIGVQFNKIDKDDLWDMWTNKKDGIRKLRNDIIHNGLTKISSTQSKNTLETIDDMIMAILNFDHSVKNK